jgi:hypothetical protein
LRRRTIGPIVAIAVVVLLAAGVEFALGREAICKCGVVKLWHGVVQSSENSQHLSDWYTPSHIVHGIWFFFFGWLLLRRWPMAWRLAIAVAIEAAWEVVENTPFVIDRYRDSIINSMSDIVAMMMGFGFAASVRWWVSAIAIVVMEIGVAMVIRDNLLLNILMLIHPFEAIKRWQAGG